MRSIPFDIGAIHLVGIGGIGMSGIAEILHNLGYLVTGSDVSENYNVTRLKKLGIKIFIGHNAENVKDASVLVKSTAVSFANPEVLAAREKKIPVVRRSEMLAELTKLKSTVAISGSHGKTTTTSMIAHIFEKAGLEPTILNGGIINTIGSNAKLGKGDWLVAEADESDGTFVKIPATIGVITNIDPEHLDYWKTFNRLEKAFLKFLKQLPFYGFGVLNHDHKLVREMIPQVLDRKIYTYSLSDKAADIYVTNVALKDNKSEFEVIVSPNLSRDNKEIKQTFEIPCFGMHNVSNCLAAIAVGLGVNIEIGVIAKSLQNFEGVKRRFTVTGVTNGITIIDDYAHHPEEIKATLSSAKQFIKGKNGRVIAVMQPHRYTRLENLFSEFSECFIDADEVVVTPIYSAGENQIGDLSNKTLSDSVSKRGKSCHALDEDAKLSEMLANFLRSGDIVVCMGAGSITYMAQKLPEQLKEQMNK
ncbi:MAG TPA: UDP-N-acetylmuramate--L-alanine ligase [Alphaproteobacteria bacterium]|nr:UDP-N-acetylmuramate--L-alanine ligase [Alphaproteobacteria bacterium]